VSACFPSSLGKRCEFGEHADTRLIFRLVLICLVFADSIKLDRDRDRLRATDFLQPQRQCFFPGSLEVFDTNVMIASHHVSEADGSMFADDDMVKHFDADDFASSF
jgi:hypothetical protein